jgi:uncharacterized membrane protein
MRTLRFVILLALLALLALPAAARDWRVADFHTTIAVMPDGTSVITERITCQFIGQFNGIYRTIPVEYPGPHGTNYTLFLDVRGVTDQASQPLKYEKKRDGAYLKLKIYVPGAEDATRTVQINYTVRNAIRFFDDHDELYWNVTGNDWPVPIDHASAYVSMPDNAAGSLRGQAFTGVYRSVDQEATVKIEGKSLFFETTNPLPMRGGLTIDVFVPKGILEEPGALTRAVWWLRSNSIVFLPVFAFAVMFTMWWYKGRDPESGMSVAPMYDPPEGMSPAELGTLVDDRVDGRDITCTLIDLAVRGYLRIEENTEQVLFWKTREYTFQLIKPREQWGDLRPHEREILSKVFQFGQDSTPLSSLKNKFYTAVPTIKEQVFAALKSKGMYSVDPSSANGYRMLAVILIAAPFVILQVTGKASFFLSPAVAIASIALAVIIVLLFGYFMTAKTLKGVRTRIAVLGLQEFLTRVEEDRLRRMPPDTFEKFLPFAMALGVEDRWAQKFQGILQTPPSWYSGHYPGGAWNPIYFSNSMQSLSSQTYSTFVSAPRSSSSGSGFSGGGGGGFSGGGFGGGGGGAF